MTEQDHRPQGPPRTMILATDLSGRCDRATDRAAALAAAWGAALIAVHALDQPDTFYAAALERRLPAWRDAPDAVSIAEEELRRDLAEAAPGITAIVEKGEPAEVILGAATRNGAELIVTGIARDEFLGRFGLGATVDRLLRRARLPLLVVRQRVRGPYRSIVVATDFSDASRCALRTAAALFPDRRIGVFHAYGASLAGLGDDSMDAAGGRREVAARDFADFLLWADIPDAQRHNFELIVERGEPARLLQQHVREQGVDLVVIGTHGRSALFEMLIGSTATAIISAVPSDILVVREPRAAVGS